VRPAIASPLCASEERSTLLNRFLPKISPNPALDRTLVSFQANRKIPFFGWFKYKEGFSASLVDSLVRGSGTSAGILLDPFAGAGTALFVSRSLGWDSIGIEVLPVGPYVMEARLAAERVRSNTFREWLDKLPEAGWAKYYDSEFALKHIPITEGAFPPSTERAIAGCRAFANKSTRNPSLRLLLEFACFSVLEAVSYTRKDGQYLRWDYRAGKDRVISKFDKGQIQDFDTAIKRKLNEMYQDIAGIDSKPLSLFDPDIPTLSPGTIDLRFGSCLNVLLDLNPDSVDLVFTSPPYCNRYDYTRTYALELVYLGFDAQGVKNLRQEMLSCTVENRSKMDKLKATYAERNRCNEFRRVISVFKRQTSLQEVTEILDRLGSAGELNNANIPKLVKNYFFEMCFVIYELSRVLRTGGQIVMINDNVRYGGEEVPVDLILSDFAEQFGFRVKHIWTLARGKGNSSQQMGLHGRSELRKCVYVWEKR
jgi:hypothetical protein